MAQPATQTKLEELRLKIKADPKSRLFYQLAEELRKAGHFDESEHVLRSGLVSYPTYLAAWVSLGRTLREQKNDTEAVHALQRALELDPGNVVAARILADAYLALGNKLEAVKKYKLVHALLPSDEELRNVIDRLDRDLQEPVAPAEELPERRDAPAADNAPAGEDASVPSADAEVALFATGDAAVSDDAFGNAGVPPAGPVASRRSAPADTDAALFTTADAADAPADRFDETSPFDRTRPPFEEAERVLEEEQRVEQATGDVEPMSLAHEESPFEEPVSGFTSAAFDVEAPAGMHVEAAPLSAELPVELPVFDTEDDTPERTADDTTDTITMADIYVGQGLVDEARHIYERLLARDPGNAGLRAKLDAITPRANPKIARLEQWLTKVTRREVGRV
jgi:tetratricopeptide (TPR) repeat protein